MSIPLLKAADGQCRWVEANSQPERILVRDGLRRARSVTVTPDTIVCGHPVKAGSSYCPHHHGRVYVPKGTGSAV